MKHLELSFTSCFGIRKLQCRLDFSKCNTCAIYARNGIMKTSFSNTFQCIQENNDIAICDKIFKVPGSIYIDTDDGALNPDEIFVIKSYENYYESKNLAALLVNSSLKKKIQNLLDLQDRIINALSKMSGMKVEKTVSGKKVRELELVLIHDFHLSNESFLLNLDQVQKQLNLDMEEDIDSLSDIKYSDIFDEGVLAKILSEEFQNHINDFLTRVNSVCEEYPFLKIGELTLPGLDKISKELKKNRFFVNQNMLYLNGDLQITDTKSLESKIKEITNKINSIDEFKKLSKFLSDVKGMNLRRLLEIHPDILPYLVKSKIDKLRILLWKSYFVTLENEFQNLKDEYDQVKKSLNEEEFKKSPWKHALKIFDSRFSVPFEMRIANYESAVLGESLPRVEFYFQNENENENEECQNQGVTISRDELESLGTLSQGERRALYLLNIIFDIEQRKLTGKKTLYIIDDIADSFDYKNKYAIIEYLLDLKRNPLNNLIILSHNFDFYRTVASRLDLKRINRLVASITKQDEIQLTEEKYQKHPFYPWRQSINRPENFIALIPFVRNLVEYGRDFHVLEDKFSISDYDILTCILHVKSITKLITVKDIAKLYEQYLVNHDDRKAKEKIQELKKDNTLIIDLIRQTAEKIDESNKQLEYKIILSMAIRLISEKFMIDKIAEKETYQEPTSNQTRYLIDELIKCYPEIDADILRIFDSVNIVTPEQIHFNSFMYEPLVDMDILELMDLYQKINNLDEFWDKSAEKFMERF